MLLLLLAGAGPQVVSVVVMAGTLRAMNPSYHDLNPSYRGMNPETADRNTQYSGKGVEYRAR